MKTSIARSSFGEHFLSLLIVAGVLFVVGFACGKSGDAKPIPAEYQGAWTGADGSTITIRGDGSGDYVSGGTKVTGGSVEINDAEKTLSITFVGIGPSLKIEKAPSGNQMTLSGVVYKKAGTSSDTQTSSSSGDIPSDSDLQDLARRTLLDFNDAIQKDDFTDFHSTLSKAFQKEASAEKLAGVFHAFVTGKADFKEVQDLDAKFSTSPAIVPSAGFQMLQLKGYYPTSPRKTNFELKYINEDGDWKLSSININTKDQ